MTVLAEKLAERKDLVTRIGQLDDEIAAALIYEEGETQEQTDLNHAAARAASDRLSRELVAALDDLQAIENLIRATNVATSVVFGNTTYSLSEAIVLRDRLKTEHAALKSIADSVEEINPVGKSRYFRTRERRKKDEINQRSVTSGATLRERADLVAKQIRLLDAEVQKINWNTEV